MNTEKSESLSYLIDILEDKTKVVEMAVRTAKKNILIKIENAFKDTPIFEKVVVRVADSIFDEYLKKYQK